MYKRARLSTGMSQERAAEMLAISPESLKQYEGDHRVPPDAVVARMVTAYRLPWLALEHSRATDSLGVLPDVEPRTLPMASITLHNRLHDATGRLDALLRIAEDGVIDQDERPEFDEIVTELRETLAAIYQVIYSPEAVDAPQGKREDRPGSSMPKRSRFRACAENNSQIDYSTGSPHCASPNFTRRGGASL